MYDHPHTNRFIKYALNFEADEDTLSQYVVAVSSAEMHQRSIVGKDTLNSDAYRIPQYSGNEERKALRKQIYNELISKKRLNKDDDIIFGKGGALPKTEIKKDAEAFFIIGLPASGKSGIATSISDQYGAIILDSDYAKRKFPEFSTTDFGASVVHEESSVVVFGGKGQYAEEPSVLQYAVNERINLVIPKIGDKAPRIATFAKTLKKLGYTLHLVLVRLDREEATKRALVRFMKTKRYVPLSLIFDEYGNNPTITFYDMKQLRKYSSIFKSFTMISTDVPIGEPFKTMIRTKSSPEIESPYKNRKRGYNNGQK